MTAFKAASIVYVAWFSLWILLEALGYLFGPTGTIKAGTIPWYTLSELFWNSEDLWHPAKLIVYIGFAILAAHLATRWP